MKSEWVSDRLSERDGEIKEKSMARTHINHMENCPPSIEIEFIRLDFNLKQIKSYRLEFNIIELKSNILTFCAYVDEITTSDVAIMWDSSSLYSI